MFPGSGYKLLLRTDVEGKPTGITASTTTKFQNCIPLEFILPQRHCTSSPVHSHAFNIHLRWCFRIYLKVNRDIKVIM